MRTQPTSKVRAILEVVTTSLMACAAIAILATSLWPQRGEDKPVAQPASSQEMGAVADQSVSLEGAALIGTPDAKFVVIQFSDFACRYCGMFANETLPTIIERYVDTGVLLVAFRALPRARNPLSFRAAEAALCSGRQNKFWDMHDAIFRHPFESITDEGLDAQAKTIGLDMSAFESCMLASDVETQIRRDVDEARRLRLRGTPALLFGRKAADGQVVIDHAEVGALTVEQFDRIMDELIKKG